LAPTVPQTEPTKLVIGDFWTWTKVLSTYPPVDGWVLSYSIRGVSTLADVNVVVASNVTTGVYTVTVTPAVTAALAAGAYKWQSYATLAGNRYTVDTGVFTVVPNLSALTGAQGQTHAEKTLALIEAAIEGRVPADFEHYTIAGRQIQKIPILTLVKLRAIYQSKVYRLQNPGQLGPQVLAQMNNPDGTIGTSAPVVLPPWYRALTQ
jgi:hypothetical protein